MADWGCYSQPRQDELSHTYMAFVGQIGISDVSGSSNADAPNTIQMAIDTAEPGDTILLAPGMVREATDKQREQAGGDSVHRRTFDTGIQSMPVSVPVV